MREIHFYTKSKYIPYNLRYQYYDGWYETLEAIENEEVVRTTQMGLLSTTLLVKGFRIFIHDIPNDLLGYEIKLGPNNERTNRDVKIAHNLFVLWKNGEFDRETSSKRKE